MAEVKNPFREIYESGAYKRPYDHQLASFPFLIDVEATNICNLDCIMCPRHISKRKMGFMDLDLFKKIVDEMAKNGGRGLRFIGCGEPLLHPNIFKMIRYANSKGILTHLTTNGILLDESKIDEILDNQLNSIIFSFQGITKEEYTKIRNNPFYDQLVQNIKNLIEKRNNSKLVKPYIQITTTVLDETKKEIEKFYSEWSKIVDRVDHWYTTLKDIAHLERIKPLLKRQRANEHVGSGKCTEVRTKLTIFWNGDVSACCGDFGGELVIENVTKNSLKEIWNSKKLNSIREVLSKNERYKIPLCKNCNNKFL